jgi:hypothetical protein
VEREGNIGLMFKKIKPRYKHVIFEEFEKETNVSIFMNRNWSDVG